MVIDLSKKNDHLALGQYHQDRIAVELEGNEVLLNRGYGKVEGKRIVLRTYEALYLLEKEEIEVRDGKKRLGYADLVRDLRFQRDGLSKYLIYRDLRDKGYVVKEGLDRELSLKAYEKGEYEGKPSKYLIAIMNEGERIRAKSLEGVVNEAIRQSKVPIIAVVDRRGEIIYYRGFLVANHN